MNGPAALFLPAGPSTATRRLGLAQRSRNVGARSAASGLGAPARKRVADEGRYDDGAADEHRVSGHLVEHQPDPHRAEHDLEQQQQADLGGTDPPPVMRRNVEGKQRIGVTAGASAPEILVQRVVDRVSALTKR